MSTGYARYICLEAENLVLQLADRTSLGVSERLGSLLHGADHGRGTAHEDLDVGRGGRKAFLRTLILLFKLNRGEKKKKKETYLDHIRSDKTNTTSPLSRRVVEHIVHTEPIIVLLQTVQLLPQHDIVGVHIGKYQVNLGGIVTTIPGPVANNSLDDLQHGRDPSTSRNHTNVPTHVGRVDHGTLGPAHLHGLAHLQVGQVLGDVTLGVGLDEQIEVAGILVGGDGGVGAQDFLGLALDDGGEGDVLADGQTQDIGGTGEREAVDGDIVGDLVLFLEDEILEFVGVEDFPGLCSRFSDQYICSFCP